MKIKKGIIIATILTTLAVFCYWQNNDISITNIDFTNSKVPENFNDYKILQVSDLHNKEFGKNQNELVERTKEINPDIIVVTGDLIDSRRTNIDIAVNYMSQAVKIAPTYYIPGNHESRIDEYDKLEKMLSKEGIKVLSNDSENIKINNQELSLLGMEDISFVNSENKEKEFSSILSNLKNESKKNLTILLSHRPDLIDIYAKQNIDLVFTGHAHGGQIRLPFIGGLLSPNQGFLPKYTSGIYEKDNTKMIVSRGLGNSLFPLRIFNRPELIVTTLYSI
jgi:hypothetical protein